MIRWIVLATLLASLKAQSPESRMFGLNWAPAEGVLNWLKEGTTLWRQEPPDRAQILPEYDFIVVGAGSAGCVLANRLTEVSDWNVLLIEAGRPANYILDVPVIAALLSLSDADWHYRNQPSKTSCRGMRDKRCMYPRGKVMGGSSSINYMLYTRGNRRNYDEWEAMGNVGWGYRDVLPYFLKLEDSQISGLDPRFHSTGGPITMTLGPYRTALGAAFVEAGQEMGLGVNADYNGETQTGFSNPFVNLRNGTRLSASKAYLHPINHRKNLHVKKFSLVTKILIDPVTKTAWGVEFERKGKRYTVMARKEVLVSAGAINSPQLLMLSGIGPREHLEDKDIPVIQDLKVGYNLMDHPGNIGITYLVNETVGVIIEKLLENPKNLDDFLQRHEGPFTIAGGTEGMGFYDSTNPLSKDGDPDLELLFLSLTPNSERNAYRAVGISDEVYNAVYKPVDGITGWNCIPLVLKPKSRGRIMLKDTNPNHHPLIYHDYFQHPYDMEISLLGVRLTQQMSRTQAFQKYGSRLLDTPIPGCKHLLFDSDDYWRCSMQHMAVPIYHLTGTCKMGPSFDPTAVVDPRLRVYGINRLRVIDASIMPIVPTAHTNIPTMMVAEKAADMIKEDWNTLN